MVTPADEARWVDAVRAAVCSALDPYGADVWLFGSRARGDHRPGSDIDVAIQTTEPLPVHVLPGLREVLEESTIPLFVDLVELRTASPALQAHVVQEGQRWTARKSA